MNKIIYFDKETIRNILQEQNKGELNKKVDVSTTAQLESELKVESKINLGVPFWERIHFLFSGSIDMAYVVNRSSTTSISSTEISEFKKIKDSLKEFEKVKVVDIENSSTFFRVAAGYLKMVKGGVDGLDVKEFKSVMESYDGYDTYKISDKRYIRFNNSAFVSNYKRNDLLTTEMTIYCVLVGKFGKDEFDFQKQLSRMEELITSVQTQGTLAELFPIEENGESATGKSKDDEDCGTDKSGLIELYDVVYACIKVGVNDA